MAVIIDGQSHPCLDDVPAKERILNIINACQVLRLEGYGDKTPNHLVDIIARQFQKIQREV